MKKIFIALMALVATMSINAQVVKVYKNGVLDYTATNTPTVKYKVVFEAANLLPCLFTVGPGADNTLGTDDDKKVQFTKGNLYYGIMGNETTKAWHLESRQTDGLNTTSDGATWDENHICHFFWTVSEAASYAESYKETFTKSTPYIAESKGGLTVDGTNGLFALSDVEWEYLISKRTNAADLVKAEVSVSNNGITYTNCVIIAPDNFNGTLKSEYTLAEVNSLGLVCLPATGYRTNKEFEDGGKSAGYWSSTPSSNSISAELLHFKYFIDLKEGRTYSVIYGNSPYIGRSLRLVALPQ